MKHKNLSEQMIQMVADRFKVMSDQMRLRILNCLMDGELNVTEIVRATGTGQPNVSKHLGILQRAGLVKRRRGGNQVYYELADQSIFDLCELVCDSLERRIREQAEVLAGV